jgi:LacI family transcriptional regulator
MPKATIDDVAELAGVSIKTVSRVVNREPNVRESTRDNVERAISELNYRPNKAAQNLASHHSRLIVLIYDDPSAYEIPSSGVIIRMQEGALRACRTANYELLIHPCRYRNKDVGKELQALIEQVRPDGIVLAAPLSNVRRIVTAIEETGTTLVRVSPGKKNGGPLSVVTNDRETCAEMTRFLASLGHKKIAFITGHPEHKAVGNRFLGYKDGLDQSGLIFSEGLIATGDNSIRSGEACAAALLESKDPPTAIFAANDDMAAGVIRVADRLDIKVPEQLSVAGCDDISLAQQIYPALTTINQPLAAMADEAVQLLINPKGKKTTTPGTAIVPGTLRVRDSTGPAPGQL